MTTNNKRYKPVHVYENLIITEPSGSGCDGITVYGEGHPLCTAKRTIIRNCIIDFRNVPPCDQDEAISGVCGAVVDMENVIILGAIKAMLCGNGDFPEEDSARGMWNLKNVAFIGCGRRCPEAQDGVVVNMSQCLIEDWGEAFDVRSFGVWSHRGACVSAERCVFVQKKLVSGVINPVIDMANHIGQAFNDRPSPISDYFVPGSCRGATASTGGRIFLYECYRSNQFIRLDGHLGPTIDMDSGRLILLDMLTGFSKNQDFYKWVQPSRRLCNHSVLLRGLNWRWLENR